MIRLHCTRYSLLLHGGYLMLKHQYRLFLLTLVGLSALLGCTSTLTSQKQTPDLLDSAFPNFEKQAIETPQQIFAIDENMIAFIDKNVDSQATEKGKLTQLAHAIFDRTELSLSYRAGANTTASETFNAGTANCLSLTIMTYVMTQHLGLNSVFQDINIPEFWTRRNGNTLINKHINLKVQPRNHRRYLLSKAPLVVDFDPQQGMRKFAATEITKSQMVSFFYANKAADYMISDQPSKAYAYLRAAVIQDPESEGAWLNLGVLFSQKGFYSQAQTYYEKSLTLRPSFSSAYENLALLYARLGDKKKSHMLLKKLRRERVKNPYYHMVQGDIAIEGQLYEKAIIHYKRAIAINNKPHEFHFSIALAYYGIGDIKNAHRYLENAQRRADDDVLSERYASKISTLIASR